MPMHRSLLLDTAYHTFHHITLRARQQPRKVLCARTAMVPTMRAELIGPFKPCMTEIYIHIDARMADYIRTHP